MWQRRKTIKQTQQKHCNWGESEEYGQILLLNGGLGMRKTKRLEGAEGKRKKYQNLTTRNVENGYGR